MLMDEVQSEVDGGRVQRSDQTYLFLGSLCHAGPLLSHLRNVQTGLVLTPDGPPRDVCDALNLLTKTTHQTTGVTRGVTMYKSHRSVRISVFKSRFDVFFGTAVFRVFWGGILIY